LCRQPGRQQRECQSYGSHGGGKINTSLEARI
jgi:hypothetical protein